MSGTRPAAELNQGQSFTPLPRRTVILTMVGVMLAMFLSSLDQTVVGTAMPRIIADLGGFSRYTWVGIAYMVTATTVVPIVGRLTDMYGRKWFFILGLVVFLLGSALAGLSQTMDQLIAFRAFQGIGAGAMMANAFVAIGDLFPPAERGKYQGLMAGIFGISAIVGPSLGGFVTDSLSWHWVFYINLPLGIPVVLLFLRFFPHIRPAGRGHRLDYPGIATQVPAVVLVLLGLSWGGVLYPWASAAVIGALVAGAVLAALFVVVEVRARDPLIPLGLFRNPIVSISLLSIFLTGLGMFGGITFIPLFFQGVLGTSATASGSFLTPMMLGMVSGGALSGMALSKLGGHYRTQGLLGLGLMGAGVFLLSQMSTDTSYHRAVFNIVLTGIGLGVTMPTFTIAVQNAVPYSVMGVATSSTQFFRSIGGTMGLALLGSFMVSRFHSGLDASVSPAVRAVVPPEKLSDLASNPQALMSPNAMSDLQSSFSQMGPQGVSLGQQLVQGLRIALAGAIGDVFVIALIAVAASFVVTLFLKEVPLQKRQRQAAPAKAAPVAGGGNGETK